MNEKQKSPLLMDALGSATRSIDFPDASLKFWSLPPILASQLSGRGTVAVAEQIESHYREHFEKHDAIVTFLEWSGVTDHDSAARKMMQYLTHDLQSKQRELLIHLGKGDSLVKRITIGTAETITRFRGIPIEVFKEEAAFEKRMLELLAKYRPDLRPANPDVGSDAPGADQQ